MNFKLKKAQNDVNTKTSRNQSLENNQLTKGPMPHGCLPSNE